MPTVRKQAPQRAKRQNAAIRRIMVLDALRSWAIPLPLAGVTLLLWVGYQIELIGRGPGATLAGALALLAALYGGLRNFLDEKTSLRTGLLVGTFAVTFFTVAFALYYGIVNPPSPVFTSEVQAKAAPVVVPLHDAPGRYRLLIEAHFRPAEQGLQRKAHYVLEAEAAGQQQVLEGDFSDEWARRRVGRRGSAPVHVMNDVTQHRVDVTQGSDLSLRLKDLSAEAGNSVRVEVYPIEFPLGIFAAFAVLMTVAALLIDGRRDTDDSSATSGATLAVIVTIAAMQAWADPQPGMGNLTAYAALGALVGLPAASLLWKVARPYAQRLGEG
jgi:hypothetical protein